MLDIKYKEKIDYKKLCLRIILARDGIFKLNGSWISQIFVFHANIDNYLNYSHVDKIVNGRNLYIVIVSI